jgi:macrolide transport system ATP-binding/permease protein
VSQPLMAMQIAISLMILIAAGLFTRTISNFAAIQLGFNQENVLTFHLNARQAGRKASDIPGLYERLRARLASVPGVRGATLSDLPLIGAGDAMTSVGVGRPSGQSSLILNAGPGFFSTMQIPILFGREIGERELAGPPWAAVVNQAFAKKYFGEANPLGERLIFDYECPTCVIEVIGVCGNAHYGRWWGEADPAVYLPFTQSFWQPVGGMTFELRTAGAPLNYAAAVREIVREADPRLPVANMKTQAALIDSTINQQIVFARLSSAFAFLALAIACVGLYGSVSYGVTRRAGEIGIRMALGAQRNRVLWMVLREVLLVTLAGLAIGVPAALATSKLVKSFLFGMKPDDPFAFTAAAAILSCAAAAAAFLPARNASRMDPMAALRHE